ncbi:MAG: ABC transporter substrate-binding protein [Ignavibacteriales bacterium]|nr:ABC transporter substrate-binding protein [Ignavibacteriales bacterium]
MKKILLTIIFIFSALLLISCSKSGSETTNGISITDDLGNKFVFDKKPERIITLAPNLTEMIYSLGLQKHLIGNTLYCNYPEDAKRIEKVGDMLTYDFEKIITLKPDLLFISVEGNTKETYDKFRGLGLKIFVSNPRNYQGIKKTYLDFGKIFGVEKTAEDQIAKWDSVINFISASSKNNSKKSAALMVEASPIMLAGESTFFSEFFEICGIKNIASGIKMNYPVFSREELLKQNPDYIFYPTALDDKLERVVNIYPEWKRLKSINNKNFFLVDRDLYSRPGPRFAEAVLDIFNRLHRD